MKIINNRKVEHEMNITQTLDAKGLACPMPIVRTKKAIESIQAGGHAIVEQKEEAVVLYFYIQKA